VKKEKHMKVLLRTSLLVLVMILAGVLILSCSSPNNGVSQSDVKNAFSGFSAGASQVSKCTPSIQGSPPNPPNVWTYTYVLTQPRGGSITFFLQSNGADLMAPLYASEASTFDGSYITFSNFSSGNGYFINGTMNIGGGFIVGSVTGGPYTGDLSLSMNYTYSGSFNITGNASFGMNCYYSMSVIEYVNNSGYVDAINGPTLSGTLTVNGQTYDVSSLSANVAPMNMGKFVFEKK
jgi:hypothetical protein